MFIGSYLRTCVNVDHQHGDIDSSTAYSSSGHLLIRNCNLTDNAICIQVADICAWNSKQVLRDAPPGFPTA